MIDEKMIKELEDEVQQYERRRDSIENEVDALAALMIEIRDELDIYKKRQETLESKVAEKVFKFSGAKEIYAAILRVESKIDALPRSALDLLKSRA